MKKVFKIWLLTLLGIFLLGRGFYEFYFLRSPVRNIPNDDSLFLSPANGKVIAVIPYDEALQDTQLYKKHRSVLENWTAGFNTGATLVSIMMTPLDMHRQKAPLASKFLERHYQVGKFLNAMHKGDMMDSTFQNEYNAMLFETPEGYRFRIIQIAGFVARRIVDILEPGQLLEQGEEIWLIKLGSQVSVVLDKNFEVLTQVGDVVIDAETVIAKKKN